MKNEILMAARKQSGKTQAQVAKEIEIAKTAYQRYERGKVVPNVIMAMKIAKSLNTSVEKIWGYQGEQN